MIKDMITLAVHDDGDTMYETLINVPEGLNVDLAVGMAQDWMTEKGALLLRDYLKKDLRRWNVELRGVVLDTFLFPNAWEKPQVREYIGLYEVYPDNIEIWEGTYEAD